MATVPPGSIREDSSNYGSRDKNNGTLELESARKPTYTLTCFDLQRITQTKTATVQILPTFQEQ